MDFPTFKEIFITQTDLNNIYEILEEKIDFTIPCYINLEGWSLSDVKKLIKNINYYYGHHNRSVNTPYPLYLVGSIILREQINWRNFVSKREELPEYFCRKIYLKNTGQIKELKKFLIYQYGIQEQDLNKTNMMLKEFNDQLFILKNERIQNLKLSNILRSFKDGEKGNQG